MLINGTHATTPPTTRHRHRYRHNRQPAAPAARVPRAARLTAAPRLGGTDFLTLMLAQLQESGSDQSGRQQHLPEPARRAQRSAGHHLAQHLVQRLCRVRCPRVRRCRRPHCSVIKRWLPAARPRLAAGGTVTGAVDVPQTTSQVTLNISDSSGALVRQINLGCAIGRAREFFVERHGGRRLTSACGPVHLERAISPAQLPEARQRPRWSTARSERQHGRRHRRD